MYYWHRDLSVLGENLLIGLLHNYCICLLILVCYLHYDVSILCENMLVRHTQVYNDKYAYYHNSIIVTKQKQNYVLMVGICEFREESRL